MLKIKDMNENINVKIKEIEKEIKSLKEKGNEELVEILTTTLNQLKNADK